MSAGPPRERARGDALKLRLLRHVRISASTAIPAWLVRLAPPSLSCGSRDTFEIDSVPRAPRKALSRPSHTCSVPPCPWTTVTSSKSVDIISQSVLLSRSKPKSPTTSGVRSPWVHVSFAIAMSPMTCACRSAALLVLGLMRTEKNGRIASLSASFSRPETAHRRRAPGRYGPMLR